MAYYFGTKGTDVWFGTSGTDLMYGGDGNDHILGQGGVDHIFGEGGNDFLSGGAGNDIINGGAGNDIIIGGTGRDILIGGQENYDRDTFIFSIGDSGVSTATADVITDFGPRDMLQVSDAADYGTHRAFVNTSVTSIELALKNAQNLDSWNGSTAHHTAVMFSNEALNTSYLIMDMDANGSYETGLVLQNYSPNEVWYAEVEMGHFLI